VTDRVATAKASEWIDPEERPAPKGTKILLLTRWGVAVIGEWAEQGYAGWAPLPKVPAGIKAKMGDGK
jgi:hypothetical protein